MNQTHRIIHCSALLVATWAVVVAGAQPADPRAISAEISVLPRANQLFLVEPQARATLEQLVNLPTRERDQLIRHGDARQRGIGLFIADQQGDIALLLKLAPLLQDNEQTVPYAAPVADVGNYDVLPQTVGDYLNSIYLHWFGVDVDGSVRRFERLLGDVSNPDHLVHPWIVRLRRAQGDAPAIAQLKQQIAQLPEEVRWAVLTMAHTNSLYTLEEAREGLAQLSPATRTRLANQDDVLPGEPLFRVNEGAYLQLTLQACRQLLETGGR